MTRYVPWRVFLWSRSSTIANDVRQAASCIFFQQSAGWNRRKKDGVDQEILDAFKAAQQSLEAPNRAANNLCLRGILLRHFQHGNARRALEYSSGQQEIAERLTKWRAVGGVVETALHKRSDEAPQRLPTQRRRRRQLAVFSFREPGHVCQKPAAKPWGEKAAKGAVTCCWEG